MSRRGGPNSPPEASRFTKGRSGNPRGRPRAENLKTGSAFDIVIDKLLTVTQGGVAREVTVEEALQHQTYQAAIAGNRAARREVLKMIAERDRFLSPRKEPGARRVETRWVDDPENADTALLILGIAERNPDRQSALFSGEQLLLEPWAVQAALSRRRGGQKLSEKEQADIKRCTHDADSLRWPRGSRR